MIQADPNKFYHVFTCGEFPAFDWEKGEWGKLEVKPEWGKAVSDNYDPKIHKAPLWIGHPFSGAPAEGWIAKSGFEGRKLFNAFDYIDENFVKAVQDKKYQYVSCEFGKVMGVEGDYQIALGATNIPKVSGQKPLEFEGLNYSMAHGHTVYCPISEQIISQFSQDFGVSDKKYFFQNQNTKSMNEHIKKLAMLFAIDIAVNNTEELVFAKISEKFSGVTSENKTLEDKVKSLEDERVKFAIDQAIKEKRILPKEKESFESLLRGNFEAARAVLFSIPVNKAAEKDQGPSGGSNVDDPTNAGDKFSNEDGTKMNYEQFLKKVGDDPSFAKNFSNEELTTIPGFEKYAVK